MNFMELQAFRKLISRPIEKRIFDSIDLKEGTGFVDCVEIFYLDGRNYGFDSRMVAYGLEVINGKVSPFKREVYDVSLKDFISDIKYPFISDGNFSIEDELNVIEIKTKLYSATRCSPIFSEVLCMQDKTYLGNSLEYEKMAHINAEDIEKD